MDFDELNKADWEQIAGYLSGEMEINEANHFEQRINFSEKNKKYFEQVKEDWNNMEQLKQNNMFDTDKAWDKLYNKFEEDGLLDTKSDKSGFKIGQWAKIAAILVIGIVITALVYNQFTTTSTVNWQVADTYENTNIKQITLPDGSIVSLNANSKIYYPESFEGNTRTIEFEGDGFFEITKNPAKPFIIKAKGAEIKVLGTSFNVNTKKGEEDVEVLVKTGKVQLRNTKNRKDSVILEPDEMGKLVRNSLSKEKNTDKNYLAWKTRKLNFEDVEFDKTIEVLNRVYNVNITYDSNQVSNNSLNTTWDSDPLDTILQIICDLKQLQYKKEGNTIVLTKK